MEKQLTLGTTTPIYIPFETEPKEVKAGGTYFIIKIHSSQAAFTGHFWEKVKRLIITSQVKLNHPLLGDEPLRAIQRAREVRPNRAEKLGLSSNLISLVPATMDRVSLSLEFVLDKENRLATLGGLINDDAFLAAVSLVPGAAMAARTIGRVSQKLIQSFLDPEERQPILQFSGDFNIAGGELKEGYYVVLGTRDEQAPLPRPLPGLELKGNELLSDGQPVVQWSGESRLFSRHRKKTWLHWVSPNTRNWKTWKENMQRNQSKPLKLSARNVLVDFFVYLPGGTLIIYNS
jgi:hypothetical protein